MSEKIEEIYDFEEFRLNVSERLLLHQNEPVTIPDKAFEVLRLLVRNAGSLVEKGEILREVWAGTFVEENNLDKNISILRRALGERKGGKKFIETVRGHGYRFVAKVNCIGEVEKRRRGEEDGTFDSSVKSPPPFVNFSPHRKIRRSGNVLALAEWRRETEPDEKEDNAVEEPDTAETFRAEEKKSPVVKNKKLSRYLPRFAVLVLAVFTAVIFINRFLPPSALENSSAAPFERFKIKRYADNGSFNRAVVSPDGKFIAYTDKKSAIWLKNAATDSNVKILPEVESGGRQLIGFSPNDDYLYFYYNLIDGRGEILKMALFGSAAPQKIAEDIWSQPAISPDGKQITFIRYDAQNAKFALITANSDGTGERTVIKSKENERFDTWIQSAAFSPDASRIACIGRSQAGDNITRFIMIFRADDGAEVLRIKAEPSLYSAQAVAWLPDSDNLLLIGNDSSLLGQIYRYTISTETWKRVTNDLSDYQNLSVTADGKTILTTIFNNQANLWILPEADARRARQITFGFNTIDDGTGVSWTPNERIVYATNATGRWEIWMIDANGKNQKQLTNNCAGNETCEMPFVSPDGSTIVFQAMRGGRRNIWRMDIDGGNPTQLTTDGGVLPFVTPDGQNVIYVNRALNSSTLWQVPIKGGEPRQISKIQMISVTSLSPDGKRMAFGYYDQKSKMPWKICTALTGADNPEKCFDSAGRSFPRWTADGAAFYTLASDYSAIWRQLLDGERKLFLEFPDERINNFAFSRDGKQLLVARSRPVQNIVALTDGQ